MADGDLFIVWGYVAGAVLPPNITSGDMQGENWFRITHEAPESFKRLDPPGVVEARLASGTWVTGTGRRTRTRSPAVFQVPVRVKDPDGAMRTAQEERLPRHLAATSAMTGSPLFAVPVAFHAAGEPEQWRARRSEARVNYFMPARLDSEAVDLDAWTGVIWAAEHDYTARRAAVDMYHGNNRFHSHGDDPADVRAALLTYFFVLERIANRIARFHPLRPRPNESAPMIKSLEHALEQSASVEDKVQAVRVAAQNLQALHSRGMKRRVKEAGRTVGLDDAVVRVAGDFTDLRNASLGHVPTVDDDPHQLIDWLPKAQECAHSYLSAYLRWVGDRGFAAND